MSPSDALNVEKLVAPIAADNPTGVDLRADRNPRSLYRQIRDARDEAQAAERRQLMEDDEEAGSSNQADWRPVFDLAVQALEEHTKDVEIAVFLVEALVRREGLAGLGAGFRLLRELCAAYWEQLHPAAADADGLSARLTPLAGLNDADRLILDPLYRLPITEATSAGGPFDCAQYRQAVDLTQRDEATREARIARGAVTLDTLKDVAAGTSPEFYARAVRDLAACSEELEKLAAVLTEKCGRDAPSASRIRTTLGLYGEALRVVAPDKVAAATATATAADATPDAPAAAGAAPAARPAADGPPPVAGAIANREEAFQTLLKLAEFFRRTEPHTPVSYALEEAVRWGRMKLPDLLEELIPDEASRQQIFKRVGIRPPPS